VAKANGFTCDYCSKFEAVGTESFPKGWVRLRVVEDSEGFDLCSSMCLVELAAMRHDAETSEGETMREFTRRQQRAWREAKKASENE